MFNISVNKTALNKVENINSLMIATLLTSSFIAKVLASLGVINEGLLPILIITIVGISIMVAIIYKIHKFILNRTGLYLVYLLMFYLLISVSIYGLDSYALEYLIDFMAFGVTAFILLHIPFSSKKIIYYTMLIGNLIIFSFTSYVIYTTEDTIYYNKMEMGATYALLPSIMATFIYFSFLKKKSISKSLLLVKGIELLSLLSAVYMTYLVVTKGSRGAVLSIVILLMTIIYIKITQKLKERTLLLYPLLFLLCSSFIVYIISKSTKILYWAYNFLLNQGIEVVAIIKTINTLERDGLIGVLNARDRLYIIAFEMIKDSPIIGNGVGSYGEKGYATHVYPHNLFIQLLVEGGLFLFIPFVFIFILSIVLILKPWKEFNKNNSIKLLLLLFFTLSVPRLFVSSYFWRDQAFWLMIFLTLMIYNKAFDYREETDILAREKNRQHNHSQVFH